MLAELTHRPQHGDATVHLRLRAEALQRSGHRSGVGIVAFVDQQRFAVVQLDPVSLPAALESAEVGEREAGQRDIGPYSKLAQAGMLDRWITDMVQP